MTTKCHFHADDDALDAFSDDVGSLWCRPVTVLDSPPSSFLFLQGKDWGAISDEVDVFVPSNKSTSLHLCATCFDYLSRIIDFVCQNVPCIIKNAVPSLEIGEVKPLTLTLDEIICLVGEEEIITVDVTPDGHGDCIRTVADNTNGQKISRRIFVKPHEVRMSIGKFRDTLRRCQKNDVESTNCHEKSIASEFDCNGLVEYPLYHPRADEMHFGDDGFVDGDRSVVYYSKQNDCLRTEMAKLFSTKKFPATFPFAEQAFGTGPPEAINLWIGNERSVSAMHKDHYENLFYVCSGQKEFLLCPPPDSLYLSEGDFLTGSFCPQQCSSDYGSERSVQSWAVAEASSNSITRWIEPDINHFIKEHKSDSEFPLLSKTHPIRVLVSEGEMLYIPSLWHHRVTQTCETVGVNYWYDMKFNQPNWCYFNFLQNLKAGVGHIE